MPQTRTQGRPILPIDHNDPGPSTSSSSCNQTFVPIRPRPTPNSVSPQSPNDTNNWVRVYPPENKKTLEFKVKASSVGIRNCPPRNSSPMQYFYLFLTRSIWEMLARETNTYANEQIGNKQRSGMWRRHSRLQDWVDVSVSDMKKLIAIIINMGLSYRNNIVDYWDTDPYQNIPFYSATMSLTKISANLVYV